MKNFKEIAEKCLAGELNGTFKNRQGDSIPSEVLCRNSSQVYPYAYYSDPWVGVTKYGNFYKSGKLTKYDIIDFIPDNMKEQIQINIPEGKVPVMEQTEKGVVITWKEKELTYDEIYRHLHKNKVAINYFVTKGVVNNENESFLNKTNILRKLTNIRNYFGKPDGTESGFYIYKFNENEFKVATTGYPAIYANDVVAFAKREHAQAAIKMLGDELQYLFKPW